MTLRCVSLFAPASLLFTVACVGQDPLPMTGAAVPELVSYDRVIGAIMKAYDVPGASVAVAKDGRLVYARGFGCADREAGRPVEPDSLFRIASLSKPITAVAILKLVEEGRLDLDAFVVDLLPRFFEDLADEDLDSRWADITIRQLLHHTAGFDRDDSGDPMFRPLETARAMNAPAPADSETIVRYMARRPLDFDPGARHVYSNFGYCILGRVIERVTERPYAEYVREEVLRPMGITTMRIGSTRPSGRDEKEVSYYDTPDARRVESVFPEDSPRVSSPDGGFYIEAMDAHGGWIASATDLIRFLVHCDSQSPPDDVLTRASLATMLERPASPVGDNNSAIWYGLGWSVRRADGGFNYWHTGSLPGATTLFVRAANGMSWVVLMNHRPRERDDLGAAIDQGMWEARSHVRDWPRGASL